MLAWLSGREPSRVLVLGTAGAAVASELRARQHDVVVVGAAQTETGDIIVDDLDAGIPALAGRDFDVVLAVDALAHVRDPEALLSGIRSVLAAHGRLMVSVPNFAHWYPRSRVLFGRWGYDRRGLLDERTLRFFDRPTVERLFDRSGLEVARHERVGLPLDREHDRVLAAAESLGMVAWPSLFTYHLLYELRPAPEPAPSPEIR
jgi:SAM-dependent methyltransferase